MSSTDVASKPEIIWVEMVLVVTAIILVIIAIGLLLVSYSFTNQGVYLMIDLRRTYLFALFFLIVALIVLIGSLYICSGAGLWISVVLLFFATAVLAVGLFRMATRDDPESIYGNVLGATVMSLLAFLFVAIGRIGSSHQPSDNC